MKQLLEPCSLSEVCSEMGGNEELLAELQEKLRDWLSLQPHLPQDVPEYLLKYLVVRTKFSLEKAKQKLDMYFTIRSIAVEIFSNRDPAGSIMKRYFETTSSQFAPLPKRTPENDRVMIYRCTEKDSNKCNYWDDFRYATMISDIRLAECNSFGDVYVFDWARMGLGHVTKLTPAFLKKLNIIGTNAYALRIKGVHIINAPPFVDRIISACSAILPPKIVSKMRVHSSGYESFYQFVPRQILPKDYGGDEVSMEELCNLWRKKLVEWRSWFLEQGNVVVDESRRPGKTIKGDDLFGFSGSFRKLDVD